ncbi:hypothetical protein H6P81_010643 [Aristolochia fimbriata]|uniref:Uncharacterized protein n=1 Tax=Aristolochia fimbriata TaxID=158543 RepID=A0AAV7ETS5_ARIFI|nr:hypothetical protein H6P81_010643 [Aristolochia fimbriata]
MERYVVPRASSSTDKRKSLERRPQWKRNLAELNGRISSKHRHEYSSLLVESYDEVGAFLQCNNVNEQSCPIHSTHLVNHSSQNHHIPLTREGISGLEFDKKGIYLATVSKAGCLTVHDFETISCLTNGLLSNEAKQVLHISTNRQLDVVRWNTTNQDEVACASLRRNEVLIFDIGYVSSDPVEVLKMKLSTAHGSEVCNGISDVSFTSDDNARLFASGLNGVIYAWDRRLSHYPYLQLTSNSHSSLNSIQLNMENWIIFGANKQGIIYAWDLRGGRTSVAFQSHKEVYNPPMIAMKLSSMLETITSLKEQSNIVPKEIHSIHLDPSCPYQLAFHLDDGWSGVLNTHSSQVTHVHCPPPAWLDGENCSTGYTHIRKPAWIPTYSIYAVGSSSSNGIHLLDFYPHKSSACHVDFNEGVESTTNQMTQNTFIPLSGSVTACAAHPLNGTIVAGTKQTSLLVISQRRQFCFNYLKSSAAAEQELSGPLM